jgi:hypothetical protein
MNIESLLTRTKKVYESCKTLEQLNIAKKYSEMYAKILENRKNFSYINSVYINDYIDNMYTKNWARIKRIL